MADVSDFEQWVAAVSPRLRRALIGAVGVEQAGDAAAEAVAWAWEHRDRLTEMDNPAGYLFRVGQSRSRRRKEPDLPTVERLGLPEVEPALVPALQALPEQQRVAVWLTHGCQWTYQEAAEAMDISASAVGTHVARALAHLRAALGVETSA